MGDAEAVVEVVEEVAAVRAIRVRIGLRGGGRWTMRIYRRGVRYSCLRWARLSRAGGRTMMLAVDVEGEAVRRGLNRE